MVAIDKRDSVSHEKDTMTIVPAEQVVSRDMCDSDPPYDGQSPTDEGPAKPKLGEGKWWRIIVTPGSPAQIVLAALVAIGIGMGVNVAVDTVPEAAVALLAIPGQLWLRALSAVVLPLIVTAMILAVQRLKEMAKGGATLARWTILYYVLTTILAILHSTLVVNFGWRTLFRVADENSLTIPGSLEDTVADREDVEIHQVVVDMFYSLIPNNVVNALASNALLSVLVTAIVVGYVIKGPDTPLLRLTREIERIITVIITFLITLAPVGVFFLILANIMRLNLADVGINLGILIGATVTQLIFHLLVVAPLIFFILIRKNPYSYWIKCSPALVTAWGTASSAATLPVTMKCVAERGVPNTVSKFVVPLGCLVNMDGTAIYFPIVVVFMAATQGITLNGAEYVILILLSTLASIGTTPIPSSSLVLVVMICGSVNVPITGMYAVVVAIDWFLDRFRTLTNVSGDLFAAPIMAKVTGIEDDAEGRVGVEEAVAEAQAMYERETRVI